MVLTVDYLHPSPRVTKRLHKLKRLVPSPNSRFMDVVCPNCKKILTVFTHAQTVKYCKCGSVIAQPGGGKVKILTGARFRVKSL